MSKEEALERLERGLRERELEDPRPTYRRLLKRLSGEDRDAYLDSVRRFEEELVPAVAGGEADPVAAWTRYGLEIASALAEGEARSVGESGRARSVEDASDPPVESLLLWLPTDAGAPGLVLSRPRSLSDPQQATLELLT